MKNKHVKRFLLPLCCMLILGATPLLSQDVAIVGMNWVDTEGWAFVALENIPNGTNIYFTDEDYDGLLKEYAITIVYPPKYSVRKKS